MVTSGTLAAGVLLATDFRGPKDDDHLLTFNPQGTRLATGCREGSHVFVFDPRSGREVARLADLPLVTSLAFLSEDVLLAVQETHMQGGKIRPARCFRCNLRRGSREVLWEEQGVRIVAVSPNGRVVAFGLGNGLVLFDPLKKRVLHRGESKLCRHSEGVAFSAGGRYAAVGLCGREPDTTPRVVLLWATEDGRRCRTFEIQADFLSALAFRGDTLGMAVATWSDVHLFEPNRGEDVAANYRFDAWVSALRFRDRGMLAVLLETGCQVSLRTRTGQVVRRVAPPPDRVLGYATPSADWSLFAAATEGGVFVWAAG